jgi:sugar/nucleoside kinase (ribokinase family)
MKRGPRGLFLGLATLDLLYRVERPVGLDGKVEARELVRCLGGPALNAAVAFADCGGQATLVTALAEDVLTADVLAEDAGMRRVEVRAFGALDRLPTSSIAIAASGERQVVSFARAAQSGLHVSPAAPDLGQLPDVVLVDGHYLDHLLPVVSRLPGGVPVVADLGSWKDRTPDLLAVATHAVASRSFRPPGTDDPLRWLADRVPFAAVTNGADPIEVSIGDRRISVPVRETVAVGTLAAGDFLHGAFAWGLADGSSALDALTFAAGVASRSCTVWDTRSWLHGEGGPQSA